MSGRGRGRGRVHDGGPRQESILGLAQPDRKRTRDSLNDNGDGDDENEKRMQATRRARMERLRQENIEEERRLASLEDTSSTRRPASPSEDPKETIIQVNPAELEELDDDEQMIKLLGFSGGFGSTKGTKVQDNHETSARGAAAKNKARKYRQYMNRKVRFLRL
jgi:U4/U6.U5 tri-snRNP-associated protein 3